VAADPKLVELARAAEADKTLPLLRVATAGQLVVGVPGPSSRFNEVTWEPIISEIGKTIQKRAGAAWSRTAVERRAETLGQQWEAAAEPLREGWGPAANAHEPDPPENLTLYDSIVWGWGEQSGLRVPAVRVSIESVTAWWVGNAQVIKGSGGGGWFAFVAFPIGN